MDQDGIDDLVVSEFEFSGVSNSKVHIFNGASGSYLDSMTCGCWKGPLAVAGIPDRALLGDVISR